MKKTVLITGGNKGIGLETTKLFLKEGYNVIVLARDFSNCEVELTQQIRMVTFDLLHTDAIPTLIEQLGTIDILVNNAGIMNSLPLDAYPKNKVEEILKINLEAPIILINEVSKGMIENGGGRIVNIASLAGEIGHPDVWYGATKAGIINATKSFSKILGAKGVVINAVAPGPVETAMLDTIPEERKKAIKGSVYLNRFASTKEVADTIYWLSTQSPEYINGTCIDINNGVFLG
jgi:3-oxoacyl-[acyl-carrier protein] reductase